MEGHRDACYVPYVFAVLSFHALWRRDMHRRGVVLLRCTNNKLSSAILSKEYRAGRLSGFNAVVIMGGSPLVVAAAHNATPVVALVFHLV